MIGYDATNALGQGLAAREKIYAYSLAYFMFFYKNLSLLSFQFAKENDIVSKLSDKIYEYFQQYVTSTEGSEGELAKYYLAGIYYYEPSFDFESATTNEIYELGQFYLQQLFQENILDFIARSKNEFASPDYDQDWKYFAHTMLISEVSEQFLNIIQQPVVMASRLHPQLIYDQLDIESPLAKKYTATADYVLSPDNSSPSEFQNNNNYQFNPIIKDNIFCTNWSLPVGEKLQGLGKTEAWEDSPNINKFQAVNTQGNIVSVNVQDYPTLLNSPDDTKYFTTYRFDVDDKSRIYFPVGDFKILQLQPTGENSTYVGKDDISVFFEFSFQPNYEKITQLFPNISINKHNFDQLIKGNFLKFSKTETYTYLKHIIGESLSTITEEQFSSLFDLQMNLLYKMSGQYFTSFPPIETQQTSFFQKRSMIKDEKILTNAFIFYSPLLEASDNDLSGYPGGIDSFTFTVPVIYPNKTIPINRTLNLGNSLDLFGIKSIRKFVPVWDIGKNIGNIETIIKTIDAAQSDEAKIIKEDLIKNFNFNPFDFSSVAGTFLSIEATKLPETFVNNNTGLFVGPYSDFCKNLINNLITNVDKIK